VQNVRQSIAKTGSGDPTLNASRWAALAEHFSRDGAVCIRRALDHDLVARLQEATERVLSSPSRFGEAYGGEAGASSFRGDKFMWMRDPDFHALALASDVPHIAAAVMNSSRVNLFYDHLLVKQPGSDVPTKWHNDQNYWPIEGRQICSVWIALDHVDQSNGRVGFVRGSHLWSQSFQPMDFTRMSPIIDPDYLPVPDIDGNPSDYEILAWDLEPGDCVVFSGLCLHGAPGNQTTRTRRAVSVRYTGDDVRFAVKRKSIPFPHDPGLRHGDKLSGDLFPIAAEPRKITTA
jgi:ectoine hydroxylase-related dioxygenase (phytanoyl-CoA dioxygenase family)